MGSKIHLPMKKVIALFLILLSGNVSVFAQGGTAINPDKYLGNLFRFPVEITPGIGIEKPLGPMEDALFMGQGWKGGIGISVPLLNPNRSQDKDFQFNIGIAANVDYSLFKNDGALDYVQSQFRLSGGNLNPTFSSSPKSSSSLQASVGPRFSLGYRKAFVAAGVQFGYLIYNSSGYSIVDSFTGSSGTPATSIPLYTVPESQSKGLVIKPSLEIGYNMRPNLQLWVGASPVFGPALKNAYTIWQPNSAIGDNGYSNEQITSGQAITRTENVPYRSVAYGLGLKTDISRRSSTRSINDLHYIGVLDNANLSRKVAPAQAAQKRDQRKAPADAPQITYPSNGNVVGLINGDLHLRMKTVKVENSSYEVRVWHLSKGRKKLVLQQAYSKDWDGIIKGVSEVYARQKPTETTYYVQVRAVAADTVKHGDVKKSKASPAMQQSGLGLFTNNGFSNLVNIVINNSCFPQLGVSLDSAKCSDSNKIKVWGHIELNSVPGIIINSVTITDFKENSATGAPVPVSNLVPGMNLPPVNNSQFSFNTADNMCNKKLFISVLVTYTCALTQQTVTVPCADTISMPCCRCTYCADSMIINSINSSIKDGGNNQALISQSFSVTPTNITQVTAEIVHMSDSVNNEICHICDKQPADVYHFTGANTIAWNGGANINGSAGNNAQAFPSKIIKWQSNNQGSLSMNLNIGLPSLPELECCSSYQKICIRYTFTDKNCKTCDIIICYELSRETKSSSSTKGLAN